MAYFCLDSQSNLRARLTIIKRLLNDKRLQLEFSKQSLAYVIFG